MPQDPKAPTNVTQLYSDATTPPLTPEQQIEKDTADQKAQLEFKQKEAARKERFLIWIKNPVTIEVLQELDTHQRFCYETAGVIALNAREDLKAQATARCVEAFAIERLKQYCVGLIANLRA